MASDNALYRRHRPQSFADLAGQEAQSVSLAQAVASGQPHHAYLITGSRGTGKTTTARLIAMGLNCAKGPTDAPCGECESCLTIAACEALDVQEIDAASSNSVDDIRALKTRVAVAPAFGSFRVFILDEAHMLSASAWNALLKTLEEPPSHVVIILCTTDFRKVPQTVASRCQRLTFRAPTAQELAQRVAVVAEREGASVQEGAARLLARGARGSYRDVLQLLEEALARAQGGEVTEELVRALLGQGEEAHMLSLITLIAEQSLPKALGMASTIASAQDPEASLRDLEGLARDVLIASALGKLPAALRSTPARDELVEASMRALGAPGAARLLDEVANALVAIRAGADPRIRFELAVAKASDPSLLPPSDEQVARRLDRLEGAVMSKHQSRRPTGQ